MVKTKSENMRYSYVSNPLAKYLSNYQATECEDLDSTRENSSDQSLPVDKGV